ncbi:hypothetical protein SDC9_67040 [bioreactor metagenome]|uniref:Uncharacterized protein n=1 Tax=bioreactor metagenome TaxID=1076179 RepID=A0A644XWY3_9ZZZZ
MGVPQVGGDFASAGFTQVLHGGINAADGGVGLWSRGNQNDGLGEHNAGLGQAELPGGVTGRFDDGQRHGIGEPHVLCCRD